MLVVFFLIPKHNEAYIITSLSLDCFDDVSVLSRVLSLSQILMNVLQTPTTVTIAVLTHLDRSAVPVTLDSLWPVMATPAGVS